MVLVWDKTFAELPLVSTREDPLQEYYERWLKACDLAWAEKTGNGIAQLEVPLTGTTMGRSRQLLGERSRLRSRI